MASELDHTLKRIKLKTWLIVSGLSIAMLGLLFGIVQQGSLTIGRQRQELQNRLKDQVALLAENRGLAASLEASHRRAAEGTERFMRRVGSDLHDGPAQSIGLATMHLGDLLDRYETSDPEGAAVASKIDALLKGSLDQIRSLAAGLAPPELDGLGLADALKMAVRNHEWATGTHVEWELLDVPREVPPLVKICLYRFLQESLNNAYRHACGRDQCVKAFHDAGRVTVEVSDEGPGIKCEPRRRPGSGLGLSIMRDRIESLGGTLRIESGPVGGTRLAATVEIAEKNP